MACIGASALVGAALAAPRAAHATDVALTPVVDTTDIIPGSSETFDGVFGASLRNDHIVFGGSGDVNGGIYSTLGGLSLIADRNTPVPGVPGSTFLNASNHSFDGTHVAFYGNTLGGNGVSGIYSTIGGLSIVADTNTPIPNSPFGHTFKQFENLPMLDNGQVVLRGQDQFGNYGVYLHNGLSLTRYADWQTAAPDGSGNYSVMFFPNIEDGRVGFVAGTSTNWAEFVDLGSGLAVQADINTPMPGGPANFAGLGRPHMEDGDLAFAATDQSGAHIGIYANFGGGLTRVVDVNTPIPGGVGTFTNFFEFSLSDETIAFWATGTGGQEGLFFARDGMMHRVIGLGDTINGQTVTTLDLYNEGLDGDSLAFAAGFGEVGFLTAIYVVTIPEPAAFSFLLLAALATRVGHRGSG